MFCGVVGGVGRACGVDGIAGVEKVLGDVDSEVAGVAGGVFAGVAHKVG